MKFFSPFLLTIVFASVTLFSNAQTENSGILAVFQSKALLKDCFKGEGPHLVKFELIGPLCDKGAQSLKDGLISFGVKVIDVTISASVDNKRSVVMTLANEATLAYFTKALITNQIRFVMADQVRIRTEELND